MFEAGPGPRVFGLLPGSDFAGAVARGLVGLAAGQPPEALARAQVLVNSGRMRRRLRDAFDAHMPILVPRIGLVGAAEGAAASALRRRLELASLVSALLERAPDLAPATAAFDLAGTLMRLADEMQVEGVSPEVLERLDPGPHAAHWGRSLAFLRILEPLLADPEGSEGARLRAAVSLRIAAWQAAPPETPVIVAGSTGSRGAVLDLMLAVARLPQGALVLPGFDAEQPAAVWRDLAEAGPEREDHPQYRFARLLHRLGMDAADVRPWPGAAAPAPARNRLLSLALRPAPVTHQWRTEGPRLGDLVEATGRMTLIEAGSPRLEALAIALRLRKAVDDGVTAALVTPDRALGRRVAAALGRWGIEPDDSAGRPLAQTAPGRLLRHVAALFARPLTAEALLILLKHPLVASGADRREHLRRARNLELRLRRRGPPFPTPGALTAWRDDDWTRWLANTVFPQIGADAPLAERVARHRELAEALAAGPWGAGAGGLWDEEPGRRALAAMDDLAAAADAGGPMSAADYEALLATALSGEVREATGPHPGVMILGTLEARVGGVELAILGGLNEGVWPATPEPDPWLNRRMRTEAGLLLPERQIGLSAHDFQQAIAAPEVVLTRALRDAEAETVPSRWLNRLVNLLDGLAATGGPAALRAMRTRGAAWLAAADRHGRLPERPPAARPSPRPPVAARPRRLSVTRIATLVRDPYAVYARSILGFEPLPPLRSEADAALRGQVLHRIVELFVAAPPEPDLQTAAARLEAIADAVLADEVPWPVARRLWHGRLRRLSAWFAAEEARRRQRGAPVVTEERRHWPVPGLDFTLVGQPDRVDRLHGGGYALVDYKSGRTPGRKEVMHFDRQLLLGAAMLEGGAFPELPPDRVAEVAYISLSGNGRVDAFPLPYDDGEVALDVAGTVAGLRALVRSYDRRDTGYTARRAAFRTTWHGDFDHLGRFGEWDDSDAAHPEEVG